MLQENPCNQKYHQILSLFLLSMYLLYGRLPLVEMGAVISTRVTAPANETSLAETVINATLTTLASPLLIPRAVNPVTVTWEAPTTTTVTFKRDSVDAGRIYPEESAIKWMMDTLRGP
ncbi:Uncharacterized protein FKW44_021731 [Caligus rogercresseyi]|uniref:Uncharacterized protein n=1 Tax=Caligus rogercresseyi TaxID=217165 RepID=A0A7T8GRS0_CALRO|nr:Uncharacterized protein FKW44_021731 [Caligus rogercresseyi]